MQTSKVKKGQSSTLESQYGILMDLEVKSAAADECWSKVIPRIVTQRLIQSLHGTKK